MWKECGLLNTNQNNTKMKKKLNNCPLPSKPFPPYIYFLPNVCPLHQFDNLSHVSQMVGYTGEKLQELHSNPNASEKLHDGKGCLKSFLKGS